MRMWLFYKVTQTDDGVQVEFRRVENGNVSNFLPEKLRGSVKLTKEGDRDRAVQALVRSAGWVGDSPRLESSVVAQTVLQGRW